MAPISKHLYGSCIKKEITSGTLWRDAACEMLATFVFVSGTLALNQDWHMGSDPRAIEVGMGTALLWVALGYALGKYGGAHMNPAISLAMVVRAEITIMKCMLYWTTQVLGAVFAAFFIHSLRPSDIAAKIGNTELSPQTSTWQGSLIELWITTLLCLAALATRNDTQDERFLPSLPTGFAVGFGHFIALSSTGASMNPARSVGPAVVYDVMEGDHTIWENHWIYWVGPMGGGLLAALIVWVFEAGDKVDRFSWSMTGDGKNKNKDRCVYTADKQGRRRSASDSGLDVDP